MSTLLGAMDIAGLFLRGGFFMWPLLFCSVLGLAVILDRAIFFAMLWRGKRFPETLRGRLEREGIQRGAGRWCEGVAHPTAAVARVYLENLQREPGLRTELVKSEGSAQLERVERRLRVLATISHLAPLLGLLGTVTGLVIAFSQIQALEGAATPSDLAGGIWEALLTTVFGLIIAIPCMAAYHWFEGLADRVAKQMQRTVVMLDDLNDSAPGSQDEQPDSVSPGGAEEQFHAVQ